MTAEAPVAGREHWTHKGPVRLLLWEARVCRILLAGLALLALAVSAAAQTAGFAEFMIGDTVQKPFPGEGIYAARSDVDPPPGNPSLARIKLIPVDYEAIERDAKMLKTRFNEIYQ